MKKNQYYVYCFVFCKKNELLFVFTVNDQVVFDVCPERMDYVCISFDHFTE